MENILKDVCFWTNFATLTHWFVTLDTTPCPSANEKNFYETFTPKNIFSFTVWTIFRVIWRARKIIYLTHATFPSEIIATKGIVESFFVRQKVNKSAEFPGHFHSVRKRKLELYGNWNSLWIWSASLTLLVFEFYRVTIRVSTFQKITLKLI